MSPAIAVYLGVAVLAWGPCVFFARRFVSGGRADRLVAATLLAIGWPMTLPLLIAEYVRYRRKRRARRPPVSLVPDMPHLRVLEAVVAER